MIHTYEWIPETENSHPGIQAAKKCRFQDHNWVEEEYFLHGTSNIYKTENGKLGLRYADAPYINRILIRRPRDPAAASGRVVIEILNATNAADIDRVWLQIKNLMMREGDVYIGLTSKPSSAEALKKFNIHRYHRLSWANPVDQYLPLALRKNHAESGSISRETETGLVWDMLTDCATDARSGKLPLGGIDVKWVYLAGWSQSVGYIVRYINTFAYKDGSSVYDGYLGFGGARMSTPAVNQYELPATAGEPDTYIRYVTEPYLAVQTESENNDLGNDIVKEVDSDLPERKYRTYDIPGTTHDNEYTMSEYFAGDSDILDLGRVLVFGGDMPYPNNYPYEFAFCAMTRQLYNWAEKGIPAKKMTRIPVVYGGYNLRDRFGNAKYGWRLPMVDLPVCTYVPYVDTIVPHPLGFCLYGGRIPFSGEKLKEMYGTLENYRHLVTENAEAAVADERLLPEDKDACIAFCVSEAQRYGLT